MERAPYQISIIRVKRNSFLELSPSSPESPGHIRHPSAVRSVCGLFAAEKHGDCRIALRVPQGVGLIRRGREVQSEWSCTVERFENIFANQSMIHDLPMDIY